MGASSRNIRRFATLSLIFWGILSIQQSILLTTIVSSVGYCFGDFHFFARLLEHAEPPVLRELGSLSVLCNLNHRKVGLNNIGCSCTTEYILLVKFYESQFHRFDEYSLTNVSLAMKTLRVLQITNHSTWYHKICLRPRNCDLSKFANIIIVQDPDILNDSIVLSDPSSKRFYRRKFLESLDLP